MDFELNAEQKMLQDAVREFLKKEYPREIKQEILETENGYSHKLWKKKNLTCIFIIEVRCPITSILAIRTSKKNL
jgi:alkylation response protein AidB-like acyl-CoA dehydrogenase